MFITQLRLAVIPLLYITTANANIFIGQAVEDFQINVTNSPDDLTQDGTLTLMTGGAGLMMVGFVMGIIMVNQYNNLVTEEEADV